MQTTLAERVKLAMEGPPKILGKDLAKACGVAPASVSDWRNGETQTIEGLNLIKAAEFLNVRAKWLADGTGSMREVHDHQKHKVMEVGTTYNQSKNDPLVTELISLFGKLSKPHKHEFLGRLRGFVEGINTHNKDSPTEQITPANNERTGRYA